MTTTAESLLRTTSAPAPATPEDHLPVDLIPFEGPAVARRAAGPSSAVRVIRQLAHLPTLFVLGDVTAVVLGAALTRPRLLPAVVSGLVLVAVFAAGRLYRSRLALSIVDDLPQLTAGWLAATGVLLVLDPVGRVDTRQAVGFVVVLGFLLLVDRSMTYALARALRRTRILAHRCLVIGATDVGRRMAMILQDHPSYGLRPQGFVVGDSGHRDDDLPIPVVGEVADLAAVLDREKVHYAILAVGPMPDADLVRFVRYCHRHQCELFLIPPFAELHSVNDHTEVLWGVPIERLRRAAHRSVSWQFKRVMDVGVAAVVLALLAVPLALIALAVRLEGGPGVLFRQTRIGIDGREFSIMKFRSLRPVDETESATHWNISLDDRLGPVGKLLRRTSLDELPQLFNILRGDMSLVGPRPERPHFVREFSSAYPSYQSRDRVPCGLTGWAQIHGLRGDTPIGDRADFDNFYIENWSLWLDVKIMLKTITAVVTSPGS